jgi:beta-phosphoglucomutase-like phosphatase (HAD superfamily)
MDGALIDSEEFHWISWRDMMRKEGISITRGQFQSFVRSAQRFHHFPMAWRRGYSGAHRKNRRRQRELYRDLVRKNGVAPALKGSVFCPESPTG